MVRSLFFAIGIFLLILGAQTLIVDKWIVSRESRLGQVGTEAVQRINNSNPYRPASFSNSGSRFGNRSYYNQADQNVGSFKRVYQTRDWMPWSLLAAGTIITLYTFSTGRRGE